MFAKGQVLKLKEDLDARDRGLPTIVMVAETLAGTTLVNVKVRAARPGYYKKGDEVPLPPARITKCYTPK